MTEDEKAAAIGGGILTLAVPAIIIGSSLWTGFVFEHVWNWFGSPLINVRLSLGEAVGLMVLRAVVFPSRIKRKGEETDTASFWLALTIGPLLSLLFGWGAHQWLIH